MTFGYARSDGEFGKGTNLRTDLLHFLCKPFIVYTMQ